VKLYLKSRATAFALVGFLCSATLVMAADAPRPPPLEAYGRLPNVENMSLSPSGERYAYIRVTGDDRQVVVKSLKGESVFTADAGSQKLRGFWWAGEDHLILEVTSTQRYSVYSERGEFANAIIINVASRKSFVAFETSDSTLHAIWRYYGSAPVQGHWQGYFSNITMNKTRGFDPSLSDAQEPDLYRVDLDTGLFQIVSRGSQAQRTWALEPDGAVAASSVYNEKTGSWTLYQGPLGRAVLNLTAPLHEVALMGLGPTPGTVVVDKAQPEIVSLADGNRTPITADRYIDGYIFDPSTRRLVGLDLGGETPFQQFFEPALARRAGSLAKPLRRPVRVVSWTSDSRRMILFTDYPTDPGTFWLVDGPSVRPIAYQYPEIPDAWVGESRSVSFSAQDGLSLKGVLTLPPGRQSRALPLVVLPHGGPEAHDVVGFDWWAQAFASRGYAVFQPNFRGSDGYGLALRDKGFGEWGGKMQTDISDGVANLARQGVVDPRRVCIVGASYGGYAALAGVTLQQGLYRCAVAYGGVSDLRLLLQAVTPEDSDDASAGARYLHKFLGVRGVDDHRLERLSPAKLASRADAPILLIHGADDTVVPIAHAKEMERELRRAGKSVQFVTLKSEDHWLSHDAARKAMLAAAVTFVEANDPP
jgi:dienelactone hydrolase